MRTLGVPGTKTSVNFRTPLYTYSLRACLRLNKTCNTILVARQKIIWRHARGDLNIGHSSIDAGAVPRIIAWFANHDSNETNADLVQYHNPDDPPLPRAVRLDSIYRILRSKPDLLKGFRVSKVGAKRKLDEVSELRAENKSLRAENKSLRAKNKHLRGLLGERCM